MQVDASLVALSGSSVHARLRVTRNTTSSSSSSSHITPGNAILLDALDEPELLSMIASHLPAADQRALAGTCKLFALIVNEHAQNTTYLSSVITPELDVGKIKEQIDPTLQAPPTFGLVFCNPGEKRRQRIKALVRSLPPNMHLVGGEVRSLVGTYPSGDIGVTHTKGFALSLGAFPEATVGSFALDRSEQSTAGTVDVQLDAQLAALQARHTVDDWKVIVVVSTLYGGTLEHRILRTLQERYPNAAILGGLATGRYLLHAHQHKVRMINDGVVGLMFGGNVPMQALVVGGSHRVADRLKEAKKQLVEREHKELLGGLMFTCTARSERSDACKFAEVFPSAPLVGMPCNGEIGPGGGGSRRVGAAASSSSSAEGVADETAAETVTESGDVRLHGFTAVYGLFAVPIKSRIAPLHYTDLNVSYTEMRQGAPAVLMQDDAAAAFELRQHRESEDHEDQQEDWQDDHDDEEDDDDELGDYEDEEDEEDDEDYDDMNDEGYAYYDDFGVEGDGEDDDQEFDDDGDDFFGGQ